MEPDDEFEFCVDEPAQECWMQIAKWAKQKCQKTKMKEELRDSIALLEKKEFAKIDPDASMRMLCKIVPFVEVSRPYMVFCIVRLVQKLALDDIGAISAMVPAFTDCVIAYLQAQLDSEDVKNLLGAVMDVVRLLLRRGQAPLAGYLSQFLTVSGADGTSLEVTRCLMTNTNMLLEPLQRAQRSAVRAQLDGQLPALLRLLTSCGDYDVQTSLVECLFRLSTQPERPLLAAAWLPTDELRSAFVAIGNFDPDCRLLLNAFNRRLGAERKVHSFPAESVKLAEYALEKPDDPEYPHMWVDFNEGSSAVSVYCQRPVTDTQPDDTLWETVTVRRDDVMRARLRLDRNHQRVTLTLGRPCRQLLASVALSAFDGSQVTFTFRKGYDLHTVLGRLYGAAYKFQACEELASERAQKASAAAVSVHCRSTAASATTATTASSSAGGSRSAPRHKASVPLSTVSSGGGAHAPARRPAATPKSSVPVLAGQRAAGGGRYSPLEMSSPGRELRRQVVSPPPVEAVPVSQSSGPSVIEPTPRPPATSSAASTPGVSSTAQACVRTPRRWRLPDSSSEDVKTASAGRGRQSDSGPSEPSVQQERSRNGRAPTDGETRQQGDQRPMEGGHGPEMQPDDEPQDSGEGDLEIQDDVSETSEKDTRRRESEKELQIQDEAEEEVSDGDNQEIHHDDPEMQQESEPEMQQESEPEIQQVRKPEIRQKKQKRQKQSQQKSKAQANDEPSNQYEVRKNREFRQHPLSEQPSSVDFEASPRPSEPSSVRDSSPAPVPAPAAGRAGTSADRPAASIDSRQRASRRPRAAVRTAYVEVSTFNSRSSRSGSSSRGDNSQETSPSPPQQQRRPAVRDGASRQRADRDNRAHEPVVEDVLEEREVRDQPRNTAHNAKGARAKEQPGKSTAGDKARANQGPSRAPLGKRAKSRPCVSFEEEKTERDDTKAKKKRHFSIVQDINTEDSPLAVQHSIFSQSDSAESEFSAPWHRAKSAGRSKKSRHPRSPHIFSDIGTSTDGEKLPTPTQHQRRGGTFKRFPVYDPRSVRNKALLSQEKPLFLRTEPVRGGGRGRGGRGRRGAGSNRGAASKRGAASNRGAVPTKRGAGRAQPTGGWAERVSQEERRLQSPEVLRDEPAPVDDRDLSDLDVPSAKRRPDSGLATCFGWDSSEAESAARPTEPPPVPAARPSGRQRASRKRRAADPEPTTVHPSRAETETCASPPAEPCPEPDQEPHQEPADEMELSGQHELSAELELSAAPEPAALDASGSGHVSHLTVSANESAPLLECPPNTPLSARRPAAPAPPTAEQLGDAMQLRDAMQWQAVSPQRVQPPARDAAALTATQEFRLEDHLVLEEEASRPASPTPLDLSLHATDSPLLSPIRAPEVDVAAAPTAAGSQRRGSGGVQRSLQLSGEFRAPLPPRQRTAAPERRPSPAEPLPTGDIRAELSGMVADWETASTRSEQQFHPQQQPSALRQAVAAIRRQVARLDERDERLRQLSRRAKATQETLLSQQRTAVATLEQLGEAAAAARRQVAERILAECERLERPGPVPPAAAAAAAPSTAGFESELLSVQRELDQILHCDPDQAQLEWFQH